MLAYLITSEVDAPQIDTAQKKRFLRRAFQPRRLFAK